MRDRLAEFCAPFSGLPACTIAGKLPGIPSVWVNNKLGIREAMTAESRIVLFDREP